MKDIALGLNAGALGALGWAGVAYVTGWEIGWVAWGVGALVGFGVALGNKGRGRSPIEEVSTIAAVYRQVTGYELTEADVRAEANTVQPADDDLIAALAQLSSRLNEHDNELVVKGAVTVAIADGNITDGAQRLIGEIASALGVSETRLRGIVARLATPK